MSPRRCAYLAIEAVVADLDAHDDPLAEYARDALDAIWLGLTDAEHADIDARGDLSCPGAAPVVDG